MFVHFVIYDLYLFIVKLLFILYIYLFIFILYSILYLFVLYVSHNSIQSGSDFFLNDI